MVGEYVNTGRGKRVPISPAVPGARYRITAWALGNGSRSENSTVKSITTREACELCRQSRIHASPACAMKSVPNLCLPCHCYYSM